MLSSNFPLRLTDRVQAQCPQRRNEIEETPFPSARHYTEDHDFDGFIENMADCEVNSLYVIKFKIKGNGKVYYREYNDVPQELKTKTYDAPTFKGIWFPIISQMESVFYIDLDELVDMDTESVITIELQSKQSVCLVP